MTSEWREVRLGEVTTQVREGFTVDPTVEYVSLGLRMYAKGVFAREPKLGSEIKGSTLYRVRERQFIYNRMFAAGGSFGLVSKDLSHGVVSNEFPVFDVDDQALLPEYLELYFQQPDVWSTIERECVGTTKSRLRWKEANFQDHSIPLPSVPEQRRIVDLIGALDDAIEATESARSDAHHTRAAHRRRVFGDDTIEKRRLGDLVTARLGKMLSATTATDAPAAPYLRNANVQWSNIELHDLKSMPFSPADRQEFALEVGDVLICEGGEVGRSAVVEEQLEGIFFQKALHRVRCGKDLDPYFLVLCMEQLAEDGTISLFSSASTIPHLTGEKLRRMPVPAPPVAEQRAIMELQASLSALSGGIADELQSLQALRAELLGSLLSGAHAIPESYDGLISA